MNKYSICYVKAHGQIQDKFNIVPPKNIICYLTPMNHLSMHNTSNYTNNLKKFIENLKQEDWKALFLQRSNFQKNKFDTLELSSVIKPVDGVKVMPYQIYTCFENSVWYYPGDLYPDLKIGIKEKDFESNNYISIHKPRKIRGGGNINNIVFGKEKIKEFFGVHSDTFLFSNISEYIHRINHSELYNLTNYNFRLHLITGCRGMDNLDYQKRKPLLEYELYQSAYNRILDGPGDPKLEEKARQKVYCGDISNRQFLFYSKEYIYDSLIYEPTNIKYCYSGKVPSLIRIFDKPTLEKKDYEYLISFSIRRILLFFR
jgi:hypothetical protein